MLASPSGTASMILKAPGALRRASFAAIQEPIFQSIKVKCGGVGDTTIHVHNPPKTRPLPLLLYISPITDSRSLITPSIPKSFLGSSYTTILIRPLFSPATPFPQPLHILSFAYSAIIEQHRQSADLLSGTIPAALPPISVYGKDLGGTLATTLALTECQPENGRGNFVDAVMTRDSIFDYSPLANEYLATYARTKPEAKDEFDMQAYLSPDSDLAYASPPSNAFISGPAISTAADDASSIAASNITSREGLIKSLPQLFSKPEIAFDPFISPVLFFRGRSHDIPTSWTWSGPQRSSPAMSLAPHARSRSYVKFPPKELGLRIPWARLCVSGEAGDNATAGNKKHGKEKVSMPRKGQVMQNRHDNEYAQDGQRELQALYTEQADLMAAGMRRAIEKGHEDPRLLYDVKDVDAEERVQVVHLPTAANDTRERDEMDGVAMKDWLSDIRG